jgi:hypothetical protein
MAIKYTKIFHCKTLQNLPKLGFLVRKETIWQACKGRFQRQRDVLSQHIISFTHNGLTLFNVAPTKSQPVEGSCFGTIIFLYIKTRLCPEFICTYSVPAYVCMYVHTLHTYHLHQLQYCCNISFLIERNHQTTKFKNKPLSIFLLLAISKKCLSNLISIPVYYFVRNARCQVTRRSSRLSPFIENKCF